MHYKRTFLRRLVPAALVAAPILLMAACASIDCAMTTAVGCRYALRGDTVHDTLTILAVRPGSSDSVLVNRLVQPQAFTIPMSYGADRDQLVFQLTDTLGDDAHGHGHGLQDQRSPFRVGGLPCPLLPYAHGGHDHPPRHRLHCHCPS